jgi:hypothetical protein
MTRVEERPPPEAPPANGAGKVRAGRVRRWASQTNVVLAAVAGLVSAGIALLFQLAPGLKPDPGDNIGADVSVIALERGVTIESWLQRGFRGAAYAEQYAKYKDQLPYRGEIIYVHVAVDGHKHKDVSLSYRLFMAKSQLPVTAIATGDFAKLKMEAPSQRSVSLMFVPNLKKTGDLFLRVTLRDDTDVLAVADSRTISDGKLRAVPADGA